MSETRWHRIRHYPGRYSGFDLIEECTKPKWCCGCEFDHAFCSEGGLVLEPERYTAKIADEKARYGNRY